jgi:hypothetical protein
MISILNMELRRGSEEEKGIYVRRGRYACVYRHSKDVWEMEKHHSRVGVRVYATERE